MDRESFTLSEISHIEKEKDLFLVFKGTSMLFLGKAMAPHSSVFTWRIPGMGEPGGLPSMGSHRVGHD